MSEGTAERFSSDGLGLGPPGGFHSHRPAGSVFGAGWEKCDQNGVIVHHDMS